MDVLVAPRPDILVAPEPDELVLPEGFYAPGASLAKFGSQFYTRAIAELDKLLYDEQEAKTAFLLGLMSRASIVAAGLPGGGKSTLLTYATNIFTDVLPTDIVCVPPDMEMSPKELTGGALPVVDTVNDEETESVKRLLGMLKPTTKFVKADEMSRTAPAAQNALLSTAEEHVIKSNEGETDMPDYQLMMASMNASESKESTVKIADATASRFNAGAILGYDVSFDNKVNRAMGIKPPRHEMKAFIATTHLKPLQEAVKKSRISRELAVYAVHLSMNAQRLLQDRGIDETDSRLIDFTRQNGVALALFDGQLEPTPEHLEQGMKFAVAARLGALEPHKNIREEIYKFMDITKKAAKAA